MAIKNEHWFSARASSAPTGRSAMTTYESDLPGIGKKFEIDLDDGRQLVIVIHNTGRRELFIRDEPDADAEKLFELSDQLARQVGVNLSGAYFQPVQTETIDTVLSDDTLIEWAEIESSSRFVDMTLAETRVHQELGVSLIAVQRDDKTLQNPEPGTRIEAGDTLVVLGLESVCRQLDILSIGENDIDGEHKEDMGTEGTSIE
jgi:TrkA domain protein